MTRSESTTPVKAGIPVAKKNSDSKQAWKNRIRQACLNKVRQSRRNAENDGEHTMMIAEDYDDPRFMVEEELKLQGIRVVAPPREAYNQQSTMEIDCPETRNDSGEGNDFLFMTEDDIFELMEEIERELKQIEEQFIQEEIDFIERNQLALYETIADYEQWNESGNDRQVTILCPLCQGANLTYLNSSEIGGDIVCPNHMDGSCWLYLEARPGLSMCRLRDMLAASISTHGEFCSNQATFRVSREMISEDDFVSKLWLTCAACGTSTCMA